MRFEMIAIVSVTYSYYDKQKWAPPMTRFFHAQPHGLP